MKTAVRGLHMDFDHLVNWFIHAVSGGAILSALAGFLPYVFAVPACAYYCLLLYRDETVQKWFENRRRKKIARLKGKIDLLEAYDRAEHRTSRNP